MAKKATRGLSPQEKFGDARKPQIHILALRDGHIVGQIRGTSMPPERVVEFCSQHFAAKPVVDRCDPILL